MKTQQEIVFRCEFCNRPMFSKGHMTLHERMCRKNPNNQHKCFQYCKYLIREQNMDESGYGDTYFYCSNKHCDLHDKSLYSYKLERDWSGKKRIEQSEMVRMPLKCEYYKAIDFM